MPYAKVNGETSARERLSRKLRDNAYRARQAGVYVETVTIAQAEAAGLLAMDRCYYCNCDLTGRIYALEHKTPLCLGGPHILSNLTKACEECNEDKHIQDELEYLARLDRVS